MLASSFSFSICIMFRRDLGAVWLSPKDVEKSKCTCPYHSRRPIQVRLLPQTILLNQKWQHTCSELGPSKFPATPIRNFNDTFFLSPVPWRAEEPSEEEPCHPSQSGVEERTLKSGPAALNSAIYKLSDLGQVHLITWSLSFLIYEVGIILYLTLRAGR